ncbi:MULTISPECIES: DNA-binding transcriptional regulator KdgR [unclassified Paraburkholderia]|uniref:DNA-binding transcriptional regulator KdgR n=1 Tax=unclassified Paraburkholderia TaxID=2615204 RepID=UPI000EAFAE47|nr:MULTISPECIES: DNA-binding transcriptional regulator KdgR [unclassified Paraburkholderia]RKR45816.1 IclR family transcriptional regulator [Paraburkholderia sp. BL17N1]TDY26797.1 IclR family transcriptional regulator [Paraburkholderia sp. BL6665CI2N2]
MASAGKQRKDDGAPQAQDAENADCGDKGESASSIGRVFAILGAIGDSGQIGISELSQRLGMSKTTVHRVIQTLKALGYVTQEVETERYRLTIRLFELGAKALESVDLVREADVEMRRIGEATREAVHLGAFDEDAIIYIHKIDADYGLRMQSRIGRRNPLHSTAIGKVLLAWMDPADAREVLSHVEFRKSTQKTLSSAEAVLNILPHVREQGYGEDNEEQEEGLRCLAVPVFDRFGRVIAGLSISFPTMRCGADTKSHYVALLRKAGLAISARLGYRQAAAPQQIAAEPG